MLKIRLNEKWKALGFALALVGFIDILYAITIDPEFVLVYLAPDHFITPERIEYLQYYRLLSLSFGSLLLLIGIRLFNLPQEYPMSLQIFLHWVFSLTVAIYFIIFGYNTLTRTQHFEDPDTMNFVDVARNIVKGRGITQSTLGFNQPHFSADDKIPLPLTSQPPLYPLLLAFISWFGLPYISTGLLVSFVCYGLILLLAYQLSIELYNRRAAFLSIGFLLIYEPLNYVSTTTFSEPVGITFTLTSFLILVKIGRSVTHCNWIPVAAGLTIGLAFATRYALAPLFFLGFIFILLESRQRLIDLSLFVVGFGVPAGLVWGRNFVVTGAIMPTPNPSTVGLTNNILQLFEVIVRESIIIFESEVQIILVGFSLLILAILLLVQRELVVTIQAIFFKKRRYLLTLWALGYLTFLILQRTRIHFDQIDGRLVIPAGVIMILLWAALIVKVIEIRSEYLICLSLSIVFFVMAREAQTTINVPSYKQDQFIAASERLTWVEQYTNEQDLIIGTNTVDIPFYLGRTAVVSYSSYPYTDHLEYEKIMSFCNKHHKEYKHLYLMVPVGNRQKIDLYWIKYAYGSFITDIMFGRFKEYPGIIFTQILSEEIIYEIHCQQ